MTEIVWLHLGILVSLYSLGLSWNTGSEDEPVINWRYHSLSMYTMVVSKGCTYLAGFIQSVYIRPNHNTKHGECHWEAWARSRCTAHHIPNEICNGLVSCGMGCALSTLKAPDDMMNSCNISRGSFLLLGKRTFGYRGHIDTDTLHMCSSSRTMSISFGRRQVAGNHSVSSDDQGNNALQKKTNNGHHYGSMPDTSFKRWCTRFSRYIRARFHFDEVQFVHSSRYWLVDVYKIGPKFGVPLMHTHGLVGCGMEYALNALNAPSWMAAFYRLANQ